MGSHVVKRPRLPLKLQGDSSSHVILRSAGRTADSAEVTTDPSPNTQPQHIASGQVLVLVLVPPIPGPFLFTTPYTPSSMLTQSSPLIRMSTNAPPQGLYLYFCSKLHFLGGTPRPVVSSRGGLALLQPARLCFPSPAIFSFFIRCTAHIKFLSCLWHTSVLSVPLTHHMLSIYLLP
jgi:hypothetical protein